MSLSNDTSYLIGRWLHWLAAVIFILMVVGTDIWTDFAESSDQREVLDFWHVGFGVAFVVLLFFRIGWVVAYPERRTHFDSRWQALAARTNHWALYLLMVMVPLSGILGQLWEGGQLSLFGVGAIELSEQILDIDEGILADDMAYYSEEVHLFLKWPIYILLSLHISGALSHWLMSKLKRKSV
ncbi:MAG: cytochrome b/b6 domain-containing protein [Halopseudomonas sp.]